MAFKHIHYPVDGQLISLGAGGFVVPDRPIIGFVEGDGIGPDITSACLRIWNAAVVKAYGGKRSIRWCEIFFGGKAEALYGTALPDEALAAIADVKVAIKGPLTTPVGGGLRSINVALRQVLDLYACVRPVRHFAGVPSPLKHPERVDVVIFRENTEDVYAGIEFSAGSAEAAKLEGFLKKELGAAIVPGSALGVKPMSEFGSKRLIRGAIRYALDHGRRSVTLVHKGNIMKFTEGAFREWGYALAREEFGAMTLTEDVLIQAHQGVVPPGKIVIKDRIADIMFQQMLLRPEEYDVIATPNLNGDYLSDAVAAEVGGVGIAPGANIGDGAAVFEATHGSAPKYAGQDMANPGSLLFSGVMLLRHLGWPEAANLIEAVYLSVLAARVVTYDFARLMENATVVGTSGFADALIAAMPSDAADRQT